MEKVFFFNRNGMKTFIPNSYIELINILKQGCLESIRSAPVTLIMPCNINDLNFDGFHLTISISKNTFHDEPSILTIRMMSSVNDVTVWEKLTEIMSEISNLLSYRFHFPTLKFGFFSTMNINSFQEMKFSSFRYLGGVLFDPLCTNSMDLIYGLRSISWKILISTHSLLEWGAKDILDSTERSGDNVFFQTGKMASICDRNSLDCGVKEYMQLNNKLKSVIYTPKNDWLPGINNDEYERWARRWDEIKVIN